MISEITEENDDDSNCFINTEAQKRRVRQLIEYQKSLYCSSSSAASSSWSSSSRRSSSLLDLMKTGSTSLRRLFDMEHTSLATHFRDYSGSPITKSLPLWLDSDANDEIHDPWASIRQTGTRGNHQSDEPNELASHSFDNNYFSFKDKKTKKSNRRLTRKRSFRSLPGFCL